jgi:hypothetical protein
MIAFFRTAFGSIIPDLRLFDFFKLMRLFQLLFFQLVILLLQIPVSSKDFSQLNIVTSILKLSCIIMWSS